MHYRNGREAKMLFPQSIIGVAILKRTMGWSRTLFI